MTQADADLPAPRPPTSASPRWNTATKFLVALAVVAVLGWLLVQFQQLIAPLIFAFVLAYLLNPVAAWLTSNTRLSWGMAVNLVFLALVVGLIGVLTAAGIAIERQAVGLYSTVVDLLPNLPDRLQAFLGQTLVIGPFKFDLATADLTRLYDQLVAALQPALSQAGAVVGSLASGTVEVLGWALFVLVASFYSPARPQTRRPLHHRTAPGGLRPGRATPRRRDRPDLECLLARAGHAGVGNGRRRRPEHVGAGRALPAGAGAAGGPAGVHPHHRPVHRWCGGRPHRALPAIQLLRLGPVLL